VTRDEAFTAFVAARYRALVRTAYLLVGDRGHAEDLVQTALVKTYGAWPRLQDPANAEAYTRKTLVRSTIRWRARRWHGEVPTADLPETAALPTEGLEDLRSALARLPAGQRAVVVLRYLDDLSEAQTAAVLGISVGTVKSRASRGLSALRASDVVGELHG
jgi:RNA polymerase sigma-70 factor (sigma-E family)